MGGSIVFGIRQEKNGVIREVVMDRWTNDLPWRMMLPSFIDGGTEVDSFFQEAKPRAQWPDSRLLSRIKNGEYGLILVDFPSRSILSRNHYCTPGREYVSPISTAYEESYPACVQMALDGKLNLYEMDTSKLSMMGNLIDPKTLPSVSTLKTGSTKFMMGKKNNPVSLTFDNWEDKAPSMVAVLTPSVFSIDIGDRTFKQKEWEAVQKWVEKTGWTTPIVKRGN